MKHVLLTFVVAAAALLALPSCAHAQSKGQRICGTDGTETDSINCTPAKQELTTRRLEVAAYGAGGASLGVPTACSAVSEAVCTAGLVATACPAIQLNRRAYVTYCSSLENAAAAPNALAKLSPVGVAPTMGTGGSPGVVLGVGDCVTFYINNSIVPLVIADTAGVELYTFQCAN